MAKRVLITGASGQVGQQLVRLLSSRAEVVAPSRAVMDLADERAIRRMVRNVKPAVVINAGAYTSVDRAEAEPDTAAAINADAPRILAEEQARHHGALIHYSTDYVFDGKKPSPYIETDATNPLNVYGSTKLAGEKAIEAGGIPHLIFRTSWVYGATGHNFLRTILRLARERTELRVVDDQVGAPTSSHALAQATVEIIDQFGDDLAAIPDRLMPVRGIYHLTARGETSWHGFATSIIKLDPAANEQRVERIVRVGSDEYRTPAARPLNSRLDGTRVEKVFGLVMQPWDVALRDVMSQIVAARVLVAAQDPTP